MSCYKLSPYVHFVEDHLNPQTIKHGVFHQLTGETFGISQEFRSLLHSLSEESLEITVEELQELPQETARTISRLIKRRFLIQEGSDPLAPFLDWYVVRPLQNPSLTYKASDSETHLVRLSMRQRLFSPEPGQYPEIIEEKLELSVARLLSISTGVKSLREMFETLKAQDPSEDFDYIRFSKMIDNLSQPEKQLIKITEQNNELDNPDKPFNTVPRNLYHSSKWMPETAQENSQAAPIAEFHMHGIVDAWWEFDWIEPTVNHAFRFPNEALGGVDYGARFCLSTLRPEMLAAIALSDKLSVLEVGGGTGTFARSFITQANRMLGDGRLRYHILELSPTLMQNQKKVLSEQSVGVVHFNQDATTLDLPAHNFEVIVSNEVIADFPVAAVRRTVGSTLPETDANSRDGSESWQGDAASYIGKYRLQTDDAPDAFLLNTGVFDFIERAWHHLTAGGIMLLSEYGGAHKYPVESYHLNHEEFSIHFGHVAACAEKVGFECALQTLTDFLEVDRRVPMLSGREEHILCLNHVLGKYGKSLPYAAITESEFKERFQSLVDDIELNGFSFTALDKGYYYGPDMRDFQILIMKKPL